MEDGKVQFLVKSMYRGVVESKNGKDVRFKGEDYDHNVVCHVQQLMPRI